VIGPFGDRVFIDSYAGIPPYSVTPLEGIRNKVGPNVRVRFVPNDTHSNAVNLAAESDIAIVFVGNHPTCYPQNEPCTMLPNEGKEALDRKTIDLDQAQLSLIRSVKEANAKTIVVLIPASLTPSVGCRRTSRQFCTCRTPARRKATPVADVLFGDYNPAAGWWPRGSSRWTICLP